MTNSDTGTIEAICEAMKAIENANCSYSLFYCRLTLFPYLGIY